MGVSIQAYRARIGTFDNPPVRVKTEKEQSGTKFSTNLNYKIVAIALLLLGLFSLLVSSCQHDYRMSPSLYKYQFTTAYNHHFNLPSSPPPWTNDWSASFSTWSPPRSTPLRSLRSSHKNHNKFVKIINGNRSQRGHSIKLAHWNKGSGFLANCHTDIETILANHQPHIIGLSEANLKSSHDLSAVQHNDYQLHTCPTLENPALRISRVVAYTHKSLIVKRRDDLNDDKISAIWLEVGLPRHKKIIICQAYREWGYLGQGADNTSGTIQAQLDRWTVFLDKWEKALDEGKEVIIMMDANLDFLKWTRLDLPASDHTVRLKPLIEQLFSRIFTLGVTQLVTTATRSWPGQADSGLDHIYSNKPDKLSQVEAEFTGMSDHKIIKVSRFTKACQRSARYVRKRSYKNFDPAIFCRAIQELSWWDIYESEDPNEAAYLLTNKINTILDRLAPVKTFQIRSKYAPWLSEATKDLIKKRNQAQKVAAESKNIDDWHQYKNLRNSTKSRMRNEKKFWEKSKLDCNQHSPSNLWQNIKGWLNWNNAGPPAQLCYLGKIITSPAALATTMNIFFMDKVSRLRNSILESNTDPLAKLRESMEHRNCTMNFRPVSPDEVLKIIKGLKNSKSTGVDYIDTAVIKLVAQDILPALTHIVNLSMSESIFPSIWKHAKVIPLLKKNDPLLPKNYRPVSLLPILSKILEKAVFIQLVEYLDYHKLLSPNHHGSRHSHNTATALIQMYDQWIEEMEENKLVGIMMIDLSAAFDMVDHKLLIKKLELFGLEGEVIKWMTGYLSGRKQSVCIDGCFSPPLAIEFGVPQGSILGPLLYVIFTSDIPDLVHNHPISVQEPLPYCSQCGNTVCYVDDCTFSYSNKEPNELSSQLNLQYRRISDYMTANKLVINDDKTQLVVMAPKQANHLRDHVQLLAGHHLIKPSSTAKLLGGIVSQDGKWNQHIQVHEHSLIKQLTRRINGLSFISARASFSTRLMVANGIFASKLCYLIQLWGGCQDFLIRALQVVQTRAARTVCKQPWFTPTRTLLYRCNWLSVRQLVFYQTAIMTYKVMKTGFPVYLGNKMRSNFPYMTRQATTGAIRYDEGFSCRRARNHTSFRYRATREYNRIPGEIRKATSLNIFKTRLKAWIKTNIPVT